jgi:hypothetical protein
MPFPSALRALRSRNYRLFVAGQLVSLVGTWMQMVAQSWLIYRFTGSAAMLGLIGSHDRFGYRRCCSCRPAFS